MTWIFLDTDSNPLLRNPGLGEKRDELLFGLQSFPIGNYVVFYKETKGGIDVIRVLRGSRDIEAIFGQGWLKPTLVVFFYQDSSQCSNHSR